MYSTSYCCKYMNCKHTRTLLFVIPVPRFRRRHQEVLCWHPADIYSLYYLFNSVFYNLFLSPELSLISSWESIMFILSYFRLSCRSTSCPRGVSAEMCRQVSDADVTLSFALWMWNRPLGATTHRNANMLRDKRNQNRADILSAFPDWDLKRSGNTEKALKMSQSVLCHNMLHEILLAVLFS